LELARRSARFSLISVADTNQFDALGAHVAPSVKVILSEEAATDQRATHLFKR
jgi:hypothetical protein